MKIMKNIATELGELAVDLVRVALVAAVIIGPAAYVYSDVSTYQSFVATDVFVLLLAVIALGILEIWSKLSVLIERLDQFVKLTGTPADSTKKSINAAAPQDNNTTTYDVTMPLTKEHAWELVRIHDDAEIMRFAANTNNANRDTLMAARNELSVMPEPKLD